MLAGVSLSFSRKIHFSAVQRVLRVCAKVAFLSVIITVNDYWKGQRPLQFLIIVRTAVKSFFCSVGYLTYFICICIETRRTEKEREIEREYALEDATRKANKSQVSLRLLYIAITTVRDRR